MMLLALLGTLAPPPALAQVAPDPLAGVGIDQKLHQSIPGDLTFTDEQGHPVQLKTFFHDKPMILSLVYYRCPMLCTVVLNNLLETLQQVPLDVGRDFTVLTVSFDPGDTPAIAAAKKRNLLTRYHRPGAAAGWHLLTGTQPAITALTQAVGFRYRWDTATQQFIHPSGLIILTPEGIISRYFFGIDYRPLDTRLALLDAGRQQIAAPTDRILLFCFHYNPSTGQYTLAVLQLLRAGTVLAVLGMALFLTLLIRRGHRPWPAIAGRPAHPEGPDHE